MGRRTDRATWWWVLGGACLALVVGGRPEGARAERPTGSTSTPPDAAATALEVDRILRDELASPSAGNANSPAAAPRVDDETFLRRVSLDLIGYPATPGQITAFALDPDPDKRRKVVDQLLADARYGENWARYWRDVILMRRTEERALLSSEACVAYLSARLNDNASWDEVATAFITAKGDVREEGATALIFAQQGEPEGVVAEISRIFCGIQIQCAQCHDHPTDRWKREQFHQLAAFLPRVAVRPDMSGDRRSFQVTVTDNEPRFRPRMANQRFVGSLEHYMPDLKDPSAKGTLSQPVFFATGQSLTIGTPDAQRRQTLAEWVTAPTNPWFAKALANRLWGELVGEGFYEPLDDLGPDRQCAAPKTLDTLAVAFTQSGYDVKHLFRTILATEAYQRASRDRREPDESPFAATVAQRLRGDQLYNQVAQLLGIADPPGPRGGGGAGFAALARRTPRALFNQVFGYDPSEPRDEVKGSIPQALVMMNAPALQGAISARSGLLGQLLAQIKDDDQLTVELYLRALGREPTERELSVSREYVKKVGRRGEAYEDLLWSLVNSTEFLHRR